VTSGKAKPPLDRKLAVVRESRGSASRISDPAVSGLVDLGLTMGEARAYLALLRRPLLSAAEVAAGAELVRPKVYEALRLLEERGFCSAILGDTLTRFRAIDPAQALPGWVAHRAHMRQLAQEHDEQVSSVLLSLLPAQTVGRVHGELDIYFEAVAGRRRTTEVLAGMFARAERSVANMTQPPFLQPRVAWNVAEADALRRGVDVQALFTPPAITDRLRWAPIIEAGGEVRVAPTIPMKLLIRDRVEAMVSLRDPASGEQAPNSILIRHADLVKPLQEMFDSAWNSATQLELDDDHTEERTP